MTDSLTDFLSAMHDLLGPDWVNTAPDTLYRYGENTLPGGNRPPAAVLYPSSTAEVQAIVKAANRHGVALHPISSGNNIGLGTRSAMQAGQVVVDLGRRMNRILEVNDTLCYAEIEPGVSYQALHDELVRRGNHLMSDCTSGPPQGSVLGNAMDRGAGYTPSFDHFGAICGMEIVLGNGEVIRTGDGGMDSSRMWHVSKYSFGPALDGLFVQSNFGIVTRAGIWLQMRPPAMKTFHFSFPDDADLGDILDLVRPLKLTNLVPSLFRVANDLWLIAEHETHPEYARTQGRTALSDSARRELQARHGLGAWVASGAVYGASAQALDPVVDRIRRHFCKSGRARYISDEEADALPGLSTAKSVFYGIPSSQELRQCKWRPGGGLTTFTPGTPLVGEQALRLQDLARAILARHGLEYISMWVCAARFARGLHQIVFNRENPEERQRADDAYLELARSFAEAGYSVGRSPIDYQALHFGQLSPEVRALQAGIKDLFDPRHVLSPARYGLS
ncbi:FAD-binding oxidoreductase [Pigmentiphaga sp. GD03639]|uniref:FAD-binding oxidoreductase n=1 Tax=unclassified Pigmentiphaga TaxID=2626614 RepID=UPI000B41A15D|nr:MULTISPECIES: FAD-binding oxidoreductase [unclassified Pigmentiphaga]MDH2238572.1 FAD-binding oxidoreductase [Pigmentiphaga sp. GD03639]OVZ60103.1 FAD-binding oxidoreductase [Pigmentiphaga sp. NML030171]